MTASTPDEIIVGFPDRILPKVIGKPTFEDLNIIYRYLNTDSMSVSSYEGGSRHGHLDLIMTNDEYFDLAMDVFTAPENPGATPTIANKAAAVNITDANRAQNEATRVYRT
jgi:hypothetical protein